MKQRRSRSSKISRQTLAQAAQALQQLPPKPKPGVSLQEAIAHLHPPIQQVFQKGYSQQEVAEVLKQAGISVSAQDLQACLGAIAPSQAPAAVPSPSPKSPSPKRPSLATALQTPRSSATRQQVESVIAYLID